MVATAFLQAHVKAARRLEVRSVLVHASETTIEEIRGGLRPLVSANIDRGSVPGLNPGFSFSTNIKSRFRQCDRSVPRGRHLEVGGFGRTHGGLAGDHGVAAVRRQSGATLVELLVALALLSSIAVLSAQLVIQSTKLMATAARASRNPDLVIATEWIRRDLYEARSVIGDDLGWSDGPLVATKQNGGWLAIAPFEGKLIRTNAPPGAPPDNRVILRGVKGWRWRVDDAASVQIEFQAFANPAAHQNLTGAASYRIDRRTERLTFALRGKPGGAAW